MYYKMVKAGLGCTVKKNDTEKDQTPYCNISGINMTCLLDQLN